MTAIRNLKQNIGAELRPVKDAFTLGRELKAKEQAERKSRIDHALKKNGHDPVLVQAVRLKIAEELYKSHQSLGKSEKQTAEETLDQFCWWIFGCDFEELLEAYERESGL